MKNLREHCEKFMNEVEWVGPEGPLLQFALQIRNEALEEAADQFNSTTRTVIMSHADVQHRIRALKTDALAIDVSQKKSSGDSGASK